MLKYMDNVKEIEFILSNLRDEDREELEYLFGADWHEKALENLKDEKCLILYGETGIGADSKTRAPAAAGGFCEPDAAFSLFPDGTKCRAACVWLLSSKYVKYNRTALMRVLRNQLYLNSDKYDILYNFIYKSNLGAKNWLKRLGFKFDIPAPECINIKKDFEFFYKINKLR